jgi:membrane fusion protein (multidrug efflux system)
LNLQNNFKSENLQNKNTMKTKVLSLLLILALASCAGGNKQAQLDKLKKDQQSISDKIKTLEKTLNSKADSSVDLNATLVAVSPLQVQPFNHYIEVFGKLDGDQNIGVGAKMAGTVEEIYVKVGDRVTKDQILVKLENQVLRKSLQEIESSLKLVTDLYNKQKALWEQKIGSEVQYIQAKSAKDGMEARYASMKEQLDMSLIKSPINGSLEEMNVKIGQTLMPGVSVIRVVNFTSVKVVADLAESYATHVTVGDKVLIYFPDLKTEAPAIINFSSRYINPVNRTFSVEAHLAKEIPSLKANMVVVLKINDYRADNAISIPVDLLQNDQNGSFVFLAQKNTAKTVAHKIRVKTGQSYAGVTEIVNGLKPGDSLITIGYQDLEDGEAIRF